VIELYSAATPNGLKVSILLEELGTPYTVKTVDLDRLEQREDWFLEINPNGRIPAIIDHDAGGLRLFESGAILLYLAEKHDRFLPRESTSRIEAIQWLMFQMANIGPMQGQAFVFLRYAPEKIEYAIDRYQKESLRLFGVLNDRLARTEYLAGEYSIADIATWPWVTTHGWAGVEIDHLPHLSRWQKTIAARSAVKRGRKIPLPVIRGARTLEEAVARRGARMLD